MVSLQGGLSGCLEQGSALTENLTLTVETLYWLSWKGIQGMMLKKIR